MVRHALWSKRRPGSPEEVGVVIGTHKSQSDGGRALTGVNWGAAGAERFPERNILMIATD